jgi:protein-S-isoprenylcysteine O-methyltransferase Ste14
MFVLLRAITYATLFVGLVLVLVPERILAMAGITRAVTSGPMAIFGLVLTAAGALLALWCVLTFVFQGKGTPAPFDPPRRLVVSGPYRYLRNPMYLGAALALAGAALLYRSVSLLAYAVLFLGASHLFVLGFEEPTLARLFEDEYRAYQARVNRWLPRL